MDDPSNNLPNESEIDGRRIVMRRLEQAQGSRIWVALVQILPNTAGELADFELGYGVFGHTAHLDAFARAREQIEKSRA